MRGVSPRQCLLALLTVLLVRIGDSALTAEAVVFVQQRTSKLSSTKQAAAGIVSTGPALLPTSLLETSQTPSRSHPLPGVDDALKRPLGVLKEMGAQMSALEAKIADARRDSANTVEAQKVKYAERLDSLRANNSRLAAENAELVRRIKETRQVIREQRDEAGRLVGANAVFVQDLKSIASNLSVAKDFSGDALREAEHFAEAPELALAREAADAKAPGGQAADAKAPSMLQVGVAARHRRSQHKHKRHRRSATPQALLKSLLGSLDDLSRQQNESLTAMGKQFEEDYRSIDGEHEVLAVKFQSLQDILAIEMEKKGKMAVALDRLRESQSTLLKRSNAIREYMKSLGLRPIPISVDEAAAAAKAAEAKAAEAKAAEAKAAEAKALSQRNARRLSMLSTGSNITKKKPTKLGHTAPIRQRRSRHGKKRLSSREHKAKQGSTRKRK